MLVPEIVFVALSLLNHADVTLSPAPTETPVQMARACECGSKGAREQGSKGARERGGERAWERE
jgi:hypothetical protein